MNARMMIDGVEFLVVGARDQYQMTRMLRRRFPTAALQMLEEVGGKVLDGTDHYVVIVHDDTGAWWSYDRAYVRNEGGVLPDFSKSVDRETGWLGGSPPDWARKYGPERFTAYWLY